MKVTGRLIPVFSLIPGIKRHLSKLLSNRSTQYSQPGGNVRHRSSLRLWEPYDDTSDAFNCKEESWENQNCQFKVHWRRAPQVAVARVAFSS